MRAVCLICNARGLEARPDKTGHRCARCGYAIWYEPEPEDLEKLDEE